MPIQHLFLALLVIVIWGCNFIFIKIALFDISPLLLCALRFLLASIPAIFFIKPPAAPFRYIVLYGLLMFALQFSLLFLGMHAGMTPGIASLLVQVQVFFSILFAAVFIGEFPNIWQILGAVISFSGIALIGLHLDNTITLSGFLYIIGAAAAWGIGNLVTKKIGNVNMMSLVVWGSLVGCCPLVLVCLWIDGPQQILSNLQHISALGIASLIYIVYLSTWVGYGVWNWLINRYSVPTIVPFTLLVPVVGMLSSILVFNEAFQIWKFLTGVLVITGLCINLVGTRFSQQRKLQQEVLSLSS